MTDKADRGMGRDEVPVELSMLTAEEIARLVNCSPRTVHRLADEGVIPRPVRIGGMLRWRRPDIEGWIERGCPKVATEEVK
jgi:excisionase family DNA binding protein